MKSSKVTVAEQHLALQQAVAQVLAESPTQAEAGKRILETLGEELGWPIALYWKVDADTNVLSCAVSTSGRRPHPTRRRDRPVLIAAGRLLGEELPGSVWRSGAPGWIPDVSADPHMPRGPLAAKDGLHAAFAFPVALGKKVLGVIEFLNRDVLPPDETLLRVLGSLGRQIGLFLELKRTEEELAESARLETLRADVGEALIGAQPLPAVLQECTEAIVQHLDAAFVRIWTLDRASTVLVLRASAGMYTHLDGAHSRVKVGDFKIGRMRREQKVRISRTTCRTIRKSAIRPGARREEMVAFAGYPLIVESRAVGVLALFSPDTALAESVLHRIETLGGRDRALHRPQRVGRSAAADRGAQPALAGFQRRGNLCSGPGGELHVCQSRVRPPAGLRRRRRSARQVGPRVVSPHAARRDTLSTRGMPHRQGFGQRKGR